jgi:hypothetical protein
MFPQGTATEKCDSAWAHFPEKETRSSYDVQVIDIFSLDIRSDEKQVALQSFCLPGCEEA